MHTLSVIGNAIKTMSSREIAELVDSRHDSVKRTIETLCDKGTIVQPLEVGEQSADAMGRQRTTMVYRLDKRSSLIVVAQLCPEFTARIVDRWQELEQAAAQPVIDLNNPEHLRGLLTSYAEKAIELKSQLAIAAPKAQALDRIAGAVGSMTIREAAKDLQVKPLKFSNWLRDNRWIYKQGRSNLAHQPRIDAGYMAHKVTLVEVEGDDGVTFEKPVTQARITPKGLAKLAVVFGEVAA